ncbi:arylesterase [Flammeovirga sp. SJP92]|uniref:arylesterase n=1 Tax=Flammeovirga sp. SJP92 TaxID=1775430 RepID=UPI000786DE14|nr:arylesterase [Flammeovirga sp. SJP92]KXX68589.1 arylesterase [Flammeovirga sp. SJP92]
MKRSTFFIFHFLLYTLIGCNSTEQKKEKSSSTIAEVQQASTKKAKKKNIIFFGNSLTAGYGLEKEASFPSVIQREFDSLNINYNCINAGLSGETTAGGNERVDWILSQNKPDIFVLALGGNDALRGISPKSSQQNLESIIDKVRTVNPDCKILLAGIVPPPNMGQDYFGTFQKIYPAIASNKKTYLLKFLLENVAGEPSLNQEDGIHPNKQGAKIVAQNVIEALKPLL